MKPVVGHTYQIAAAEDAIDLSLVGRDITVSRVEISGAVFGSLNDTRQNVLLAPSTRLAASKTAACECSLYPFPHKRGRRCQPQES